MTMHSPDPHVLWTWVLCALLPVPPAVVLSVLLWRWSFIPHWVTIVFTLIWIVVLTLALSVYIPLRRRFVRYGIDDTHVAVTGGVVFRTQQQMPLSAVRYVTLLQGPLERRFGTAFLWVAGAGGWILLEGLPLQQAKAIRQRLLEQ